MRRVERSGLRFVGLDRLRHCGQLNHGAEMRPPEQDTLSALGVYKSMRRYAVKHLLSNKTHLLVWMGRDHDIERLRRRLAGSAHARAAWALLHWMQSSPWGRTFVRDWYYQVVGYKLAAGGPDDPIFHWTELPHQRGVVGKGNQAQMWIGHWLNVSALQDIGPFHQDLDEFMVDGVHQDPKRQRRKPLSWWAWLAADGNLQFGVYRRAPGWIAAPRTGKAERRADLVERHAARQRRLAQIVREPAMARDADGQWRRERRLDLAARTTCMRTRLLAGRGTHCHVAIARQGHAEGGEGWILRCVQVPVRVTAPGIKSGFAKLMIDVREYGQFICTTADDSMAANRCRLMPWPAVGRH